VTSLTRCAVAVALVALAMTGCAAPTVDVPGELVGRWVTGDSRFAGRVLEIGANSVRFETGVEAPSTHPILAVEATEAADEADGREVTLRYGGEAGLEYRLSLRYRPGSRELRLTNRPEVVWTREGGA
jgi:hypothetical protein